MPEINYHPDPIPRPRRDYPSLGSNGIIHQTSLMLDHGQILTLPSFGVLFDMTPSAEQILWPTWIMAFGDVRGASYTSIDLDAFLSVSWMDGTDASFDAGYFAINDSGAFKDHVNKLLGANVDHVVLSMAQIEYNSSYNAASQSVPQLTTDVAGRRLGVCANNGGSDFASGHPSNTLKVAMQYLIFNTATGEFE